MKSLKLKKLVAAALTLAAVTAISPVAASAAWKQDAKGWWNTEGNSWSIGWRQIDGKWYHFDSTGYMSTGWINDKGTWYYADPSGAMQTGWVNDNGTWYYTDQSGAMKTGWVIDYSAGYGQWYYLAPSGAMQTGWVRDKGTWYFLKPSGAMATGWVNDNGTWYFTSVSGAMQTGVVEIDGKVYYLQPSGAMATGEVEINGVKYTFAASGEAVGDKIPTPDKVFGANGALVGTEAGTGSTGTESTGGTTSDNDSDDDKTTSGGGGGGSHGGGKPMATIVNDSYNKFAKATIDKDGVVSFENDLSVQKNGDYVVRDLYVTDGTVEKQTVDGKDVYKVTGEKASVKTVVRVVRGGVVYYVTGTPTKAK